jgi:hypothetical protein
MAYQVISDFRGGLDARKFKLSLPPGTLTQLINGHITQGAEIEKRKAYVPLLLPSNTFGAQETDSAILVFGSRDLLGGAGVSTTITNPSTVYSLANIYQNNLSNTHFAVGDTIMVSGSAVPGVNGLQTITAVFLNGIGLGSIYFNIPPTSAGVFSESTTVVPTIAAPASFVQLLHPLDPIGNKIKMTGVTASTYFDGQAAVVTTWSNGDTLVYYGDNVETDFYYGQQGSIESTAFAMATDLCAAITASGRYTTVPPVLTDLFFKVTGGSAGSGNTVVSVYYNFNRPTWITMELQTTSVLLASNIAWTTDDNTTAGLIRTAIAAAQDGFGNNLGFTTAAGDAGTNNVTVIPPATDGYGNTLGVNASDSLSINATGTVAIYLPTPSVGFDVLSIPSQSSPNPFGLSITDSNATVGSLLVNNGVAATAPQNAVGQLAIAAGSPDPSATGAIAYTGSNPATNSTITIGSVIYTFVPMITGAANQVLIDVTPAATLANLVNAINAGTGMGTKYSGATTANTAASSAVIAGGSTTLTASVGGTAGNLLTLAQSAAAFSLTAFAGGGAAAIASITSSGTNVSNNDTVTINGKVYTFQTVLTNTDGHVLIGASADASLLNLLCAVNLTGTSGTQYAAAMTKNTYATAYNQNTTNHKIYLQAIATGSGGNALTLAKSAATLTVSGATFSGGGTNANQVTQITVGGVNLLSAIVPYNASNAQTAADVVTNINGYSGTSGFSATATNGVINLVAAMPGAANNFARVAVTTGGNVCVANCSFVVSATAAQNVSVIMGDLAANALTSTMTFQSTGYATESVAQFCARIAANINANTGTSLYLACAVGNTVFLSRATVANDDLPENVQITATAAVNSGTSTQLSATVSTGTVSFTGPLGGNNWTFNSIGEPSSVLVTATGGVPPYTYTWSNPGSFTTAIEFPKNIPITAQITDSTLNYQWWSYSLGFADHTAAHAIPIILTVTDSSSPPQVFDMTIYLQVPAY